MADDKKKPSDTSSTERQQESVERFRESVNRQVNNSQEKPQFIVTNTQTIPPRPKDESTDE
jgi:hypothetical protein